MTVSRSAKAKERAKRMSVESSTSPSEFKPKIPDKPELLDEVQDPPPNRQLAVKADSPATPLGNETSVQMKHVNSKPDLPSLINISASDFHVIQFWGAFFQCHQ